MRRRHAIVTATALRTALFTARVHGWLRTAAGILNVPRSVSLLTEWACGANRSSRPTLLIARNDLCAGHLFAPDARDLLNASWSPRTRTTTLADLTLERCVHVEFDRDLLAIASKLPTAHILRDQRGWAGSLVVDHEPFRGLVEAARAVPDSGFVGGLPSRSGTTCSCCCLAEKPSVSVFIFFHSGCPGRVIFGRFRSRWSDCADTSDASISPGRRSLTPAARSSDTLLDEDS